MNKIKIIFILPSLRAGGAERVLAFLSQSIDTSRFEPKLVVLGFEKDAVYEFSKDKTIFLQKERTKNAIPLLYKIIKKEKPNIVMSSIGQVNILLGIFSLLFPKTKFIARMASVESIMSTYAHGKKKWITSTISNLAYQQLNLIICQSQDSLLEIQTNKKIKNIRAIAINNPITSIPNKIKPLNENTKTVRFITIGRLSPEKGHQRILHSLSELKNTNFKYTIVGTGVLDKKIKDLVKTNKLSDKVRFIDYTDKVNELLIQHDIFLQGSFVEGFPNAVLESCVSGVPVLAYNVPGGTKEIIKTGENGFLANTPEEFERVLEDPTILTSLDPEKISRNAKENFSSEKILKQYETAFLELTK